MFDGDLVAAISLIAGVLWVLCHAWQAARSADRPPGRPRPTASARPTVPVFVPPPDTRTRERAARMAARRRRPVEVEVADEYKAYTMNRRAALMAVADSPGDDLPVMMYLDWVEGEGADECDDRDVARAEFIRLAVGKRGKMGAAGFDWKRRERLRPAEARWVEGNWHRLVPHAVTSALKEPDPGRPGKMLAPIVAVRGRRVQLGVPRAVLRLVGGVTRARNAWVELEYDRGFVVRAEYWVRAAGYRDLAHLIELDNPGVAHALHDWPPDPAVAEGRHVLAVERHFMDEVAAWPGTWDLIAGHDAAATEAFNRGRPADRVAKVFAGPAVDGLPPAGRDAAGKDLKAAVVAALTAALTRAARTGLRPADGKGV